MEQRPQQSVGLAAEIDRHEDHVALAWDCFPRAQIESEAKLLIEAHDARPNAEWRGERTDNARTALFEALTASGHLSRVAMEGDADEANEQCLQRLLNAWSDELPDWEKRRRFHEICEEITIAKMFEAVKKGVLPYTAMIATISDYPEDVANRDAFAMGYRSKNTKGMVRVSYFSLREDGTWQRNLEQISRSNSNDGSSQLLLKALVKQPTQWTQGSERVMSEQLLVDTTLFPDRAVTLQQMLDSMHGDYRLYGNRADEITSLLPGYEDIRAVSALRENSVAAYIEPLTKVEEQLDKLFKAGQIDYKEKTRRYNKALNRAVDQICLAQPEYAIDARGSEAAIHFVAANKALQTGNHRLVRREVYRALQVADPSPVCGGAGGVSSSVSRWREAGAIADSVESKPETWTYSPGYCVARNCVSDGARTEVGPCGLCRSCSAKSTKGVKLEKADV